MYEYLSYLYENPVNISCVCMNILLKKPGNVEISRKALDKKIYFRAYYRRTLYTMY